MFVTRKWAPAMGGMETYSLKLTELLSRTHQVDVVALPGRANGLPPRPISLLGFPFVVLRSYFSRNRPPSVLHLGDMAIWPLGMLAMLRRGRTQVVLSAHGTDVSYSRRGGLRGRLYGAYLRVGATLMRRARVIANSRATAEALEQNGWRNAVIVPLATDPGGPEPDGRHDGTLLFSGRLVRRKGLAWFVREVLPELPESIVLCVAGTVWDEDERTALNNPRVIFLGQLDSAELKEKYAKALCVIVPNIEVPDGEFEGFGLVAVEAAAAGGLVLAADHSGLKDAVMDGQTGFLLTSGDAVAWCEKIADVLRWSTHERKRFLAAAMRKTLEHFTWQRVVVDTVAAYRDLADPKTHPGGR